MKLNVFHYRVLRYVSGEPDATISHASGTLAYALAELRAEGLIEMRPVGGKDYLTDAGSHALRSKPASIKFSVYGY